MFLSLPKDIQRLVLLFLDDDELYKIPCPILNNEDDYFWKEKLSLINQEVPSSNYRTTYEQVTFTQVLKGRAWDEKLLRRMCNDKEFCKRHINDTDPFNSTVLMEFVRKRKSLKDILYAVECGINIDAYDIYGWTALMYSIANCGGETVHFNNLVIFNELIKAGASTKISGPNTSPLTVAQKVGFKPIIDILSK
jgi:ankyrin repeat protein